jgi:hypothetical protein
MLIAAFTILAGAAFVLASASDDLQEKAEALQREAAELAERGRLDEAANLKRRAMAMLDEAELLQRNRPNDRRAKIIELERLLDELRREEKQLEDIGGEGGRLADVRREAGRVEMTLREFSHAPHHENAAQHEDLARRLEHMQIALEHLHQADLHDIAEHVARRAEAAERELYEHHRHREGDVMHEIMKQLDELRHEVGRLRDELSDVRKKQ